MKKAIIAICIVLLISAVAIFAAINLCQTELDEDYNFYSNDSEQPEILAETEIDEYETEPQIIIEEPEPATEPDDNAQAQFTRYGNVGGNSGIAAFQYGEGYIRVQFSSGAIYRYTYESAGASNIEQMIILANQGQGLNSFINREVRHLFEERER